MAPAPVYSNTSSPYQSSADLHILNNNIPSQIPLGEYFFRRIQSLGVSSCFTVPGDYNLFFLDHSYNVSGMNLRNCCNELNTAYAADGYARASNKLGVAITTFGVGEMSAMNGLSGAMAEFVPVLHVVGTTPRAVKARQDNHTHHLPTPMDLLQSSNHHVFEQMASMISCCVESLTNLEDAPRQIDHVLTEILQNKRPGYLYVPSDLANGLVDSSNLINMSGEKFFQFQDKNESMTNEVVEEILNRIYSSSNPSIIGDVLIDRFQLTSTLREFVHKTKFNNFATPMGKSVLDESEDSFVGDIWGKESHPLVQKAFQKSDLVLHLGAYHNEINSGHYSLYDGVSQDKIILISAKFVKIGNKVYKDLDIVPVVSKLIANLNINKIPTSQQITLEIKEQIHTITEVASPSDISQTYLLEKVAKSLQPGDHLVCDTGSFMFGIPDIRFPKDVRYFGQQFYLSIGYALPATLGVGCAMKDMGINSRLILVEGDGAAQMTVQEFANYLHQGIKPTIFLLNNNGYTVERIINGPNLSYNDIMPDWNWTNIFNTFGDLNNTRSEGIKTSTRADLKNFFDKNMSSGETNDKIKIVEVILDKFDVPWRFQFMTGAAK